MKLIKLLALSCAIALNLMPICLASSASSSDPKKRSAEAKGGNPNPLKKRRVEPANNASNSAASAAPSPASTAQKTNSSSEKLKKIIQATSDANYVVKNWQPIYTEAKSLLEEADTTVKAGMKQDTILHLAVLSGISDFATSVIKKNKELLSATNLLGQTPLLLAAEKAAGGNAGWIIAKLIKKSPLAIVNKKNTAGDTAGDAAIHLAIKRCMPYAVQALLDVNADFSLTDKDGRSCKELAKNTTNASGNKEQLIALVKQGSKRKNNITGVETTAAAKLIALSKPKTVSTPNPDHNTDAPAAGSASAIDIKQKKKPGPKPGSKRGMLAESAGPSDKLAHFIYQQLENRCQNFAREFKTMAVPLLHHADITTKNKNSDAAVRTGLLHLVAEQQEQFAHLQTIRAIINDRKLAQAIKMANSDDQTPLFIAIAFAPQPSKEFIEFLLKNGADAVINMQEKTNKETALHAAIRRADKIPEFIDIIKLLIKYGADTDLQDGNNATAEDWAREDITNETRKKEILKILKEAKNREDSGSSDDEKPARKPTQSAAQHPAPASSAADNSTADSSATGKYTIAQPDKPTVKLPQSTESASKASTPQASHAAPVVNANLEADHADMLKEIANSLLITLIDLDESLENSNPEARLAALKTNILPLKPSLLTAGKNGTTILHMLAHNNDHQTARELHQEYGDIVEQLVNIKDNNGSTPCDIIWKNMNPEFILWLANIKTAPKLSKQDLLIAFASKAKDPVWETILNRLYINGKIDTQNKEIQSQLYTAMISSMGKEKALKLLTAWLKNKLNNK